MHVIHRFHSQRLPILVDFTNIVDQSEQHPLHVHLGFRPQSEVIYALLYADIGKDQLDDRQAPGIDLFAFGCVDPGFHLFDQAGLLPCHLDRQIPTRCVQMCRVRVGFEVKREP